MLFKLPPVEVFDPWCVNLVSRVNMEVKVDTLLDSVWIAAILWMLVISSQDLAGKA